MARKQGSGAPATLAGRKRPATAPLTDTERLWVSEYLIDGNATRAYLATHPGCIYGTARCEGSRLLAKPNVQREVRAGRDAIARRNRLRQDDVLRELMRLAFSDLFYAVGEDDRPRRLRQIPLATRRAIASIEVLSERTTVAADGETTTTTHQSVIRYTLHDKLGALGRLCTYLGLAGTSMPPLEVLLGALPEPEAEQLRTALAAKAGGLKDAPAC